jgi:ubiquinone biosynthesis protein
VGKDIADELALLQAAVPADAPGVAARTVEAQLGKPMSELYGSFDPEPFASGSVAQVHRATLSDGTVVAVKVLHDGADAKVREDLELLDAGASWSPRTAKSRLRPTIRRVPIEAAIDLRQEPPAPAFRLNFARA